MRRKTGRRALSLLALLAGLLVGGREPSRETVEASSSASLTLRIGKVGRDMQIPGKVRLILDGQAAGMFVQTQVDATMRTKPLGLTLAFASQKVQVMMRESVVTALPIVLGERRMPLLLMLRQRDQLALFAVPATGGEAALVSLAFADYELRVPPIRDHPLCKELLFLMGERKVTVEEFRKGILVDCLDEVEDIVVTGADPQGKPFEHTYGLAHDKLLDRLEGCYRAVSRKLASPSMLWRGATRPGARPGVAVVQGERGFRRQQPLLSLHPVLSRPSHVSDGHCVLARMERVECETSQAVTAGRRVHEWQQSCHLLYLGVASVAGPELSAPTHLRTLRE